MVFETLYCCLCVLNTIYFVSEIVLHSKRDQVQIYFRPSVSVDDYELKALIDEDDDDDIEPMDVDPNTLALNYAMDLYMLRPRGENHL